ncbi:hypothetical protein [Cellulosilyticum sp. I15G10I2]|uniref:hypothetical protein n=1 Tax=Cellulosilyticum sp. I15G10I2 TaxID=1892843 RepID=UPI00085C85E6|nr:hypothetical protein [Cellulosilyticum sp. I15G10I2]
MENIYKYILDVKVNNLSKYNSVELISNKMHLNASVSTNHLKNVDTDINTSNTDPLSTSGHYNRPFR